MLPVPAQQAQVGIRVEVEDARQAVEQQLRELLLLQQRRRDTFDFGDVGGNSAQRVDPPVLIAQRNLDAVVGGVEPCTPAADKFLGAHRLARFQYGIVVLPNPGDRVFVEELLVTQANQLFYRRAVQFQCALVGKQVASLSVLEVDQRFDVIQHGAELLLAFPQFGFAFANLARALLRDQQRAGAGIQNGQQQGEQQSAESESAAQHQPHRRVIDAGRGRPVEFEQPLAAVEIDDA